MEKKISFKSVFFKYFINLTFALTLFLASETVVFADNCYFLGGSWTSASSWEQSDTTACEGSGINGTPSTGDVAFFDADGNSNVTLPTNLTLERLSLLAGYTSTVTAGTTLTLNSVNNNALDLDDGVFNAPGTLNIYGGIDQEAANTFNPGTGSVRFLGTDSNVSVNLAGTFEFYNMSIEKADPTDTVLFSNSTNIPVTNQLLLASGEFDVLGSASITAEGTALFNSVGDRFSGGNGNIYFETTSNIDIPGGNILPGAIFDNKNKPDLTVTFESNATSTIGFEGNSQRSMQIRSFNKLYNSTCTVEDTDYSLDISAGDVLVADNCSTGLGNAYTFTCGLETECGDRLTERSDFQIINENLTTTFDQDVRLEGGNFSWQSGSTNNLTGQTDFFVRGSNYDGSNHSGDFEIGVQSGVFRLNITEGEFIAGTGNYTAGDIDSAGSGQLNFNFSGGVFNDAIINFSSAASLETADDLIIGTNGSTGTVTLPSTITRVGRDFEYYTGETTLIHTGDIYFEGGDNGVIRTDRDSDCGGSSCGELNNVIINKLLSSDVVGISISTSVHYFGGDFILSNGVLDVLRDIDFPGDFVDCPTTASTDFTTECAGAGSTSITGSFGINFSGTGQTIYGSNDFPILESIETSADTLYFEEGTTQTAATANLSGATGNLLTLESTNPLTIATLSPTTYNIDYVQVGAVSNDGATNPYDLSSVAKGHSENTDLSVLNSGWTFDVDFIPPAAVPEFSEYMMMLIMAIGMGMIYQKREMLFAQ